MEKLIRFWYYYIQLNMCLICRLNKLKSFLFLLFQPKFHFFFLLFGKLFNDFFNRENMDSQCMPF